MQRRPTSSPQTSFINTPSKKNKTLLTPHSNHKKPISVPQGLALFEEYLSAKPINEQVTEKSFITLYQKCSRLFNRDDWLTFIPLVHKYMTHCLPTRDQLHYWHHQTPSHPALLKIPHLFIQYENISLYLKEIHPDAWEDYCQHARQVLLNKGYYQPENWVMQPLDEEQKKLLEDSLSIAKVKLNLLLAHAGPSRDYYELLSKGFSAILEAQRLINTGTLALGKTKSEIGIGILFSALGEVSSKIPLIGESVALLSRAGKTLFETAQTIKKRRFASDVSAWAGLNIHNDHLAQELAIQLTLLRQPFLLKKEPSTSSLSEKISDWTKDIYRLILENRKLTWPQKLAVADTYHLLTLLSEKSPDSTHLLHSKDWFVSNISALTSEFQARFIPSIPPAIHCTSPCSIKSDSLPTKAFYLMAGYEKELSPLTLLRRQLASDKRVLQDEKNHYITNWELAAHNLNIKSWPDLLNFHKNVLKKLRLPLQWTSREYEEINHILAPLWKKNSGFSTLSHLLKAARTSPIDIWQNLDRDLGSLLSQLTEQKLDELAKSIYDFYSHYLSKWKGDCERKIAAYEPTFLGSHEQTPNQRQLIEKRYANWQKALGEKLTEINFIGPLSPPPTNTTQPQEDYRGKLRKAVHTAWKQGDSTLLEESCQLPIQHWKNCQHLPSSPYRYYALVTSLQEAQDALVSSYQEEKNTLEKESTTSKITLDKLSQAYRLKESKIAPLSVPPAWKLKPTNLQLPNTKQWVTTGPIAFWEQAALAAQAIEQQLGPAPCGFSVHAWHATAPGVLEGSWKWGLLLEDYTQRKADYWRLFIRLFDGRLACLQSLAPAKMDWLTYNTENETQKPVSRKIISKKITTPYLQLAYCIAISETQNKVARGLWDSYAKICSTILSDTPLLGIPTGRHLGYKGLRMTLKEWPQLAAILAKNLKNVDKKNQAQKSLRENKEDKYEPDQKMKDSSKIAVKSRSDDNDPRPHLVGILARWCRDIASYYGLSAEPPKAVLEELLTKRYFHPEFIRDMKAALNWATETKPTQQDDDAAAFKKHTAYTLDVLASLLPQWKLQSSPCLQKNTQGKLEPMLFDPLVPHCQKLLTTLKSNELPTTQVKLRFATFIEILLHRPSLQQAAWHISLFLSWPMERRIAYMQQLRSHAHPPRSNFISADCLHRLREAATADGRSIRREEEKADWEQNKLPLFWNDLKSSGESKPDVNHQVSIELQRKAQADTAIGYSSSNPRSTPRPIEIMLARSRFDQGRWYWESETHVVNPAIAKQLFLPCGNVRPKDPSIPGTHAVFPVKIDGKIIFWVKFFPEQPSMDWLVTEIDRRFMIFGTPTIELVKFCHHGQTSAALISSSIEGEKLRETLENNPGRLAKLDFNSFIQTLLRTLLTNPEDDKDDDYFLEEQPDGRLCLKRIDNDRAFFKAVKGGEQGWLMSPPKTLQVKSVIYCLEQMRLPWPSTADTQQIISRWLQIQPIAMMTDILKQADEQRKAWRVLFNLNEIDRHQQKTSFPLMFIPQGIVQETKTRITSLQTVLKAHYRSTYDAPLNGLDMLQNTQTALANYYVHAHPPTASIFSLDYSSVKGRFEKIADEFNTSHSTDSLSHELPIAGAIQSNSQVNGCLNRDSIMSAWEGEANSPKKELETVREWKKSDLIELSRQMLLTKKSARSKRGARQEKKLSPAEKEALLRTDQQVLIKTFQNLPLQHQQMLWYGFKESRTLFSAEYCIGFENKLRRKTLNLKQEDFLLRAITGISWKILDLTAFTPKMITNDSLIAILEKSEGSILEDLNISGCTDLTTDVLLAIQKHCPNLKHLRCNEVSWEDIRLIGFKELISFECNQTKTLNHLDISDTPKLNHVSVNDSSLRTLTGTLPLLETLMLKNCYRLRCIGQTSYFSYSQYSPFSAPALRNFSIEGTKKVKYLCMTESLFFSNVITQLKHCQGLRSIELKTETGWFNVPDFLMKSLKSQATKLEYVNDKKLTSTQFDQLLNYLTYDKTITHLILGKNNIEENHTTQPHSATQVFQKQTNLLSTANILALSHLLKINTTLTHIAIDNDKFNEISEFARRKIKEHLARNREIHEKERLSLLAGPLGSKEDKPSSPAIPSLQFFPNPTMPQRRPVKEAKTRNIFDKIYEQLDDLYPSSPKNNPEREEYVRKLRPYEKRSDNLTAADREELNIILATLEEIARQKNHQLGMS